MFCYSRNAQQAVCDGIFAKERGDSYFSGCYIFAINKEVKHELLENREGWENPIAP